MKIKKQLTARPSRLLLFFAGWSASPELFERLTADPATDVMICYDYRDLRFEEDLSRYPEVHLIAWSMGVRMAELALAGRYTLASATAINGTPRPIDDTCGIPPAIFLGTLHGLTPESLARFNRRMCGSREVFAGYESVPPRPFDEVARELQCIYDVCHADSPSSASPPSGGISWTRALIGTADRIFPAANQRNHWLGRCPVVHEIQTPHYPFYLWNRWNEL